MICIQSLTYSLLVCYSLAASDYVGQTVNWISMTVPPCTILDNNLSEVPLENLFAELAHVIGHQVTLQPLKLLMATVANQSVVSKIIYALFRHDIEIATRLTLYGSTVCFFCSTN